LRTRARSSAPFAFYDLYRMDGLYGGSGP
jgi:hypothetical protein